MFKHVTRNILIYSQSLLLEQLLKQHLAPHTLMHTLNSTKMLQEKLAVGGYDALFINMPKTNVAPLADFASPLPTLILAHPAQAALWNGTPNIELLTKPLHLQAIIWAIENLFLHPNKISLSDNCTLFPANRNLQIEAQLIPLTEKEVALLKYLYGKKGSVASKAELLQQLWGYGEDTDTHTVETHIYRLRQKIGEGFNLIITEENGYRLC